MSVNNLSTLSQMTGLSQAELAQRAEQLVDQKTGKIHALSALDAALVDASTGSGKSTLEAFASLAAANQKPHAIEEPLQAFTHGLPMAGFAPEAPAPPSIGGPAAQLDRSAKDGARRVAGFCGGCQPPPAPPPPAVSSPEGGSSGGGDVVVSAPEAPSAPPATPPPAEAAPLPAAPPPAAARPAAAPAPPAPAPPPRSTPKPSFAPGQPAFTPTGGLTSSRRGFAGAAPGAPAAPPPSFNPAASAATQSEIDSTSRNIQFELLKNQIQKMAEMQTLRSNILSSMHEQGMTAIRNVKA
jgi:hypothetical protein